VPKQFWNDVGYRLNERYHLIEKVNTRISGGVYFICLFLQELFIDFGEITSLQWIQGRRTIKKRPKVGKKLTALYYSFADRPYLAG
jgi:hypothetical protein